MITPLISCLSSGQEGGGGRNNRSNDVGWGGMLRRLQFEGSDIASLCSNMPLFLQHRLQRTTAELQVLLPPLHRGRVKLRAKQFGYDHATALRAPLMSKYEGDVDQFTSGGQQCNARTTLFSTKTSHNSMSCRGRADTARQLRMCETYEAARGLRSCNCRGGRRYE